MNQIENLPVYQDANLSIFLFVKLIDIYLLTLSHVTVSIFCRSVLYTVNLSTYHIHFIYVFLSVVLFFVCLFGCLAGWLSVCLSVQRGKSKRYEEEVKEKRRKRRSCSRRRKKEKKSRFTVYILYNPEKLKVKFSRNFQPIE